MKQTLFIFIQHNMAQRKTTCNNIKQQIYRLSQQNPSNDSNEVSKAERYDTIR